MLFETPELFFFKDNFLVQLSLQQLDLFLVHLVLLDEGIMK